MRPLLQAAQCQSADRYEERYHSSEWNSVESFFHTENIWKVFPEALASFRLVKLFKCFFLFVVFSLKCTFLTRKFHLHMLHKWIVSIKYYLFYFRPENASQRAARVIQMEHQSLVRKMLAQTITTVAPLTITTTMATQSFKTRTPVSGNNCQNYCLKP